MKGELDVAESGENPPLVGSNCGCAAFEPAAVMFWPLSSSHLTQNWSQNN